MSERVVSSPPDIPWRPPAPTFPAVLRSWTMTDGLTLRGRLWVPADAQRPIACIYFHGIQSHGGWYEWSGSLLAGTGLLVAMPDRRGSGLNAASRGDVASADRWLRDAEDLRAHLRREFGVERLVLVGVSWGGKLALAYARRFREIVGSILLIAPGVFPRVGPSRSEQAAIALSRVIQPRRMFKIPLQDPSLFTDFEPAKAYIASDPLSLRRATARLLVASRMLDFRVRRLRAGELSMPVHLVLAQRDRIVLNDETERWLRRVAGPAITVDVVPAAHTLEFEPDRSQFAEILRSWDSTASRGR